MKLIFASLVALLACAAFSSVALAQEGGYTAEELQRISSTKESHHFEAEVHKLMDIIINSLYSTSEIFLRELISNASDALDKLRYFAISNKDLLKDDIPLDIKIKADPEANTLTIFDTGIGMTKEELVQNLGTIARSGTMNFIKNLQNSENAGDIGQIGQFGVGFYSAFLVADRVTVHTKSPLSDKQYVWEADSQQSFSVYEDPKGNTLGRGTAIVLHLKEGEEEYLEENRLQTLVKQYSQFIDFPIYLWASHEETVEKEIDENSDEEADDSMDIEEDEESEEEELSTIVVHDWERMNNLKPIWTRKASDIEEEEYNEFFHALSKGVDDPMAYTHFKAEGDINFKALLFVPPRAPHNLLDTVDNTRDVKLYVKRVFITDDFAEVIPRYLSFLKGVIDSDDLQLNVSREMLQQTKLLKAMQKKVHDYSCISQMIFEVRAFCK